MQKLLLLTFSVEIFGLRYIMGCRTNSETLVTSTNVAGPENKVGESAII